MNDRPKIAASRFLVPASLFAAALGVRLWHLAAIRPLPSFHHPYEGLDGELYTRLGRLIASGDFLPPGLFDTAPLYSYWLGLFFRVFGDNPLPPRIAQALLGAAAVLLVRAAGRRIAGPGAGNIAGIVAALYPPFLLFEGTLQSAALVPFTTALLVIALLGARRSAGQSFIAGLLLGFSILLRPDLLLLTIPLTIWMLAAPWGRRRGAIFLAALLVPIVPFSAIGSARSGGFVPLTAHGGIHFYLGNHEGADGRLSPVEGIRPAPAGFARDARAVARRESGENLAPAALSRYWSRRGFAWILSDIPGYLRLLGQKTFLFWNDYELPNNEDLYFLKRYSPPLRIPLPLFGLIAPFALYGLFFAGLRRRDRALFAILIAASFAAALLFFVTGRYRLPMLPALIPLAGAGAAAWAGSLRTKRPIAAALLPLLLFCNLPSKRFDFAAPESRQASSHLKSHDYERAEAAYRRALEIRSGFDEAERGLARVFAATGRSEEAAALYRKGAGTGRAGRNDLAAFLAEQGRTEEAIAILDSLLAADRNDPHTLANRGACYMETGNDSLAARDLAAASRIEPEEAGPILNLAILRTGEGRFEEALSLYDRHLAIDPASKKGLFNAGAASAMTGDLEEALRFWARLEKIDPSYPNLRRNIDRARRMTGGREQRR